MRYILKYFDKNIIEFEFIKNLLNGTIINILKKYKENEKFLPLALKYNNLNLLSRIKYRTIPKNRNFVHKISMKLNLNLNNIEGITSISKSLSLNDCY